jgi:hypothetical protein
LSEVVKEEDTLLLIAKTHSVWELTLATDSNSSESSSDSGSSDNDSDSDLTDTSELAQRLSGKTIFSEWIISNVFLELISFSLSHDMMSPTTLNCSHGFSADERRVGDYRSFEETHSRS